MATPATRMMLFKSGKSFPLHLLRGSLLGGSSSITSQFISDPAALLQTQQKPIFSLLGDQSNAGLGSDMNGVLNWRFGGFGERGRVEARGKSEAVIGDEDEDDFEDVDYDEEIEDFDEDAEFEDGVSSSSGRVYLTFFLPSQTVNFYILVYSRLRSPAASAGICGK
ncbi:hypothetical protein DKX38_025758 [Salix brachista]|uniref:Uncharacterized protein n=1 Tax=Salix brachista TaxID=2182728 RepID=A0A5N5JQF5_9ROSI|nr:hypothetical protein DKX38_025758 [Salix brachista]